MTDQLEHRTPAPLPANFSDLHRKRPRSTTLNDYVEDQIGPIYSENEDFRALLMAVDNKGAVEGNLTYDNAMAAVMLRDRCPEGSPIREATLKDVAKSIQVVLRRYGASRLDRQRAWTASANVQPAIGNGNGHEDSTL